ncbi:MAG: PD-(D/E)XK nuclease family protein [Terracidiphilus sp.]
MAIVADTRASADDFVRSFSINAQATVGLHRFSIGQFALQIGRAEMARRGLAPLTSAGAAALAVRCVFEVRTGHGFKFFGPVADKPGFASALASTFRELRGSGVAPEELRGLGDRGADLSALLGEYCTQLEAGKLADIFDVFAIASEQVASPDVTLGRNPVLLLDVQITSVAEHKFLTALKARSSAVFATIADGDERSISAYRMIADEYLADSATATTSLDRVQHYVFGPTPESSYKEDGKVQFFSAPGEGRECVEIVRRIQAAAKSGMAFDHTGIALRSPQTYAPMLEAALERAGIDAYFARGVRRPDPSGRAFVALLLCAEEGLSAKRFAEYLSLGQIPSLNPGGEPPAARDEWVPASEDLLSPEGTAIEDAKPLPEHASEEDPMVGGSLRTPWKWEELLIEAAVLGGRDRWERRLKGLDNEIERKIAAITLDEPDSPKILNLERQRANLGHLRRFALPILDVLNQFPDQALWGEWLTLLQSFVTMVLHRPEHVLAALADLHPIAAVGPVTLTEVRESLSDRLTQLSVEPPRSRYGRVFIGTCDQFRARSFRMVFVPGLAERIFPQKLREDPILLDGDRRRINANPALKTAADRASEERLQLRIVAGAAEETLFFSYPRVEVGLARPRVPSFYALDIRRTTLGSLPIIEEFEIGAAQNSGAELAWLAPEHHEDAIDDIEFDLSVLRPLLTSDPEQVRGAGRYLLELSPDLGRSLRSRWARWNQKKWSATDGLCEATEPMKAQLAQYRLTARAYSPTALQSFAACPYKFFLSAIHRLALREESLPLQMLDPLTRGSMYHSVLAQFFRHALPKKMLPISPGNVAEACVVMDSLLEKTAADYYEQYAPAIERVWRDEVESIRSDLRGWLTQAAERRDGHVPDLIEFAFGLPLDQDRDQASTSKEAILPEGFSLRGIVDLSERGENGEIRLTDHKTGKNRTEPGMVVGKGEVLQPVLYSLAVEALRKAPIKESRLSFCTAAGGYSERSVVMDQQSREAGLRVLRIIDASIRNCFLPPAPKENGCNFCEFASVCGPYEEIRMMRKASEPLEQLVQLRGMK